MRAAAPEATEYSFAGRRAGSVLARLTYRDRDIGHSYSVLPDGVRAARERASPAEIRNPRPG
jgi:hypothetical protein